MMVYEYEAFVLLYTLLKILNAYLKFLLLKVKLYKYSISLDLQNSVFKLLYIYQDSS